MKKQDYHTTLLVGASAKKIFQRISQVYEWWTADFEGSAEELNDTFTTTFGETWINFRIAEVIPDKKIVWEVTDCYKHWINNKTEWKGTRLVWEISEINGSTEISMTHVGLVPGMECFEDCEKGWNFYVNESLRLLITTCKGLPETAKVER